MALRDIIKPTADDDNGQAAMVRASGATQTNPVEPQWDTNPLHYPLGSQLQSPPNAPAYSGKNNMPAPQPIMDQPPAPTSGNGGGGITRAQPQSNATFAPSSVQGIYKATAPDGSITFTDRPGGTFDANDARPNPSGNQYDGAGRRIIGAQPGQLGVNRAGGGDFAAGDLTGNSGAKFLYRPQQGQDGADAGTKSGAMPGTSAWLNANNAPVDPLSSPDAAASFANNKNAISQLRRGDGQFNKTIYDPSHYRDSQLPPAGQGFPGGINPLDIASTGAKIEHERTQDAVAVAKQQADRRDLAEKESNDIVKPYMDDPRVMALPPGDRAEHAAMLALPELLNKGYANSKAYEGGTKRLAQHATSLIEPRGISGGISTLPPQNYTAGDLGSMQVQPDHSIFGSANMNLIGPGHVKGADGSWQKVGPADTSPGSQHVYHSSERNNLFGTNSFLTKGGEDPFFGPGNANLASYASVFAHENLKQKLAAQKAQLDQQK